MKTQSWKKPTSGLVVHLYWTGAVFAALTIFVFASLPERQIPRSLEKSGEAGVSFELVFWKAGHFVGFSLFASLITLAISKTKKLCLSQAEIFTVAVLVATGIALTSEATQFFSPGRIPRVNDIFLDLSGTLIGIRAAFLWKTITERER